MHTHCTLLGAPSSRASTTFHQRSIGRGGLGTKSLCINNGSTSFSLLQIHLEERLLDQAQARALYTPLFGGVCNIYNK